MHRSQTLCRLQMHKFVSEQMTADAAFIDPFCLAHPGPEPSERPEEIKLKPRSTAFPGGRDCPGDQVAPV